MLYLNKYILTLTFRLMAYRKFVKLGTFIKVTKQFPGNLSHVLITLSFNKYMYYYYSNENLSILEVTDCICSKSVCVQLFINEYIIITQII